ncbi:MAG: hypothetical protein NTW16_05925, partial [Bacteroidetes bacterium]|nr:hypothetical protein [Bacteroidota bacterium]
MPKIIGELNDFTVNRNNGVTLNSDLSINGILTMTNGNLSLGAYNFTLGSSSPAVAGTPGVGNMIVTDGIGEFRKTFAGPGSYEFPVGDASGTAEYSPITLNFGAGTFTDGYVAVTVTDSKHPFNASATNYLTRYWTVASSGITDFSCDVTGTYVPADIEGGEGSQVAGKYDGALPWKKYSPLAANTLAANGVTGFSDFTGITAASPIVSITPDPISHACQNGSLSLKAEPVGDPTFTYLWSEGGATTQSINPSTLTAGTFTYTVTVTDGNGFTGSNSIAVDVKPAPAAFNVFGGGSYCAGGTGVYIFLSGSVVGVNYELWKDGFATGTILPGEVCCGLAFPGIMVPGEYTIVGTDIETGCTAVMNGTVTVTENPLPNSNPSVDGTATICSGASTNITVTPSEIGTNYQLRNNADNSLVGIEVPGTGGPIDLPTGPLTTETSFNVLASVATTGCSVQLAGIPVVSVIPAPDIDLSVSATDAQVCSGIGTNVTVAFSEIGIEYQLRNDADNSPIGLPVAGNGGTIYLPTGPLASTTTFNVLALVPTTICSAQLTGTVTITTVESGPITTVAIAHVCPGATTVDIPVTVSSFNNVGSFSLTFGFTPGELSSPSIISRNAAFDLSGHDWPAFDFTTELAWLASGKYKVSGLGFDPSDGVTLGANDTMFTLRFNITSGTTSSSLTLMDDLQGTACEFTGTAFDYTPFCDSPTPAFYITGGFITNPVGQVNNPGNQVVCNGANTTDVIFGTTNTVGTTTYAWTIDTPGIGLPDSGDGDITAFTAINMGTEPIIATIEVTPTLTYGGASCIGLPETFTITVNPTGKVNQPTSQVVCIGTHVQIPFSTINTGGFTTYFWTNTTPGIGLDPFGLGDIDFYAVNPGTSPLVATIFVTPTYTNDGVSCTGLTKAFSITVNPTGQVNDPSPASQVVCHGSLTTAVNFSTINTGGTTLYLWDNDTPSINLSGTGSGNIAAFTATNTTAAPVTATITVTPYFQKKSVSCIGIPKTFTITVNPHTTLTGASQAAAVCSGSTATINLTGLLPGSTSKVYYTIDGIAQTPITGLLADGLGAAIFTSPTLTDADNGKILQITGVTTTSSTPNCSESFAQDVTLSVNPNPTLTGASQDAT